MPKNTTTKTNTKEVTQSKLNEVDELKELKSIAELSTKVNETLNYVNEYKRQGLQANANDVMNLYKIVSDYEQKIKNYRSNPRRFTGNNNGAQRADLAGRYADADANKRMIAGVISESMEEIKLDAKNYKNLLNEKLTDKERKNKETKELLDALTNYRSVDDGSEIYENKKKERANAKQRLLAACIGYVKNSKNEEAKTIVYDMAAVMGKQSILAFDKLKDKDLSEMSTRRHLGYLSTTTGDYKAHYLGNSSGHNDMPKKLVESDICDKLADKTVSQQEKDAIFDKYMIDLYVNDRFAHFPKEVYDKVNKELGKNATEAERRQRLGELAYKEAPWNKINLDDTTKSKASFAQRQKVMRQWFPDDSRYLYGPTIEKSTAKKYYNLLDNGEYNGFVRSMKNSPEYTALIKSLKEYTKEKDIAKDEKNLKAVKEACVNYLDHYKQKKDKSEFAKMRGEKVKELLDSLGGAPEKTDKRTGTLTNAKELEESGNSVRKTVKSGNVTKREKTLGHGIK